MSPSPTRLRLQALATAVKTTIKHFISKNYPRDWDLAFHVQFAILRQLDQSMIRWTIEDVFDSKTA